MTPVTTGLGSSIANATASIATPSNGSPLSSNVQTTASVTTPLSTSESAPASTTVQISIADTPASTTASPSPTPSSTAASTGRDTTVTIPVSSSTPLTASAESESPTPSSTAQSSAGASATTPSTTPSSEAQSSTTTVSPTGAPNFAVPTVLSSPPSATTTISPSAYASNLAHAHSLNLIYSKLTPQSACVGSQVACIDGEVATCNSGGAFDLSPCLVKDESCFAMPMNTTTGAIVGCWEVDVASNILGTGVGGVTATTTAGAQQSGQSQGTHGIVVTHTTLVTVNGNPPVSSVTSGVSADAISTSIPEYTSTPSPSSDGGQTIIQSIKQAGDSQPTPSVTTSQPMTFTIRPPNTTSLVVIPVPGNYVPVTSSPQATPSANVQAAGDSDGNGSDESRTTNTVQGTPTVSVFYTVTVTAKETQTVTVLIT